MARVPRAFVIVHVSLFLAVCLFASSAYAVTCPKGNVAITEATRSEATAAGIPTSSSCWNPNDTNAGEAAGEAKQWLKNHATQSTNISCLNAQFAEKLERFMRAVPGGTPTITDGYRDPGKQAGLVASGSSKAGACQSYHNYGLGADFNNNSRAQTAWMRANAAQYGIKTIGAWDPNHFQDANGISGQCGVCSNSSGNGTLPDTGAGRPSVPPMSPPPPPPPPPQMQPAQQPQPLPTQPQLTAQNQTQEIPPSEDTINTTPYLAGTCSPKTRCVENDIYYRTSTCVDQLYKACTKGCENAACKATSSPDVLEKDDTRADITIEEKPIGSAYDLIGNYADPIRSSIEPVGTAAEVALNYDTSNDVVSERADTGPRILYPKNTANLPLSPSQQTFTSEDLSNPPISGDQPRNTFALNILQTMKNALLYALTLLKPFGGSTGTAPPESMYLE